MNKIVLVSLFVLLTLSWFIEVQINGETIEPIKVPRNLGMTFYKAYGVMPTEVYVSPRVMASMNLQG